MARLNKERQQELEPIRVATCKQALEQMGFAVEQIGATQLRFIFRGSPVLFYPYSGWHTGKTIKDGRGFKNLINQLKAHEYYGNKPNH